MNLRPIMTLEMIEEMQNLALHKLMDVIGQGGASLMVGGCVRNWIINKPIHDIDIATKYPPEKIVEKLKTAGIKVILTGIKHGTVTAVMDTQNFEITTLRQDVETDGRHAEVVFTDDWIADAKRRDFTMNTLLADIEGNVYDPLGSGLVDLKARQVKFVGAPAERIAEDYLRILRFFRFHAYYGEGDMDQAALEACRDASQNITSLSRERITSEYLKILSSDKSPEVLNVMRDYNILLGLLKNYNEQDLCRLISLQNDNRGEGILIARLYVVNGFQPKFHEDVLRLTHKQKNFLVKLVMASRSDIFACEKSLKKAIYYHGNDLMMQGYLIWLCQTQGRGDEALMEILQHWQAPKCPITGEQLIAEGYVTGPDLGQELERRKEEWLEGVV